MKLESKLFDRIRVKPRHPLPEETEVLPGCAWEGCSEPGRFRAPKGSRSMGEYHNFCLEHVRHYNAAFNFFAGMPTEDIEKTLDGERATNGRPDWGANNGKGAKVRTPRSRASQRFADPLNLFARVRRNQGKAAAQERTRPTVNEPDRRALETLGLSGGSTADEIKRAYKTLVKIHHPDANGGDKASEERLRTIIAAYAHLKSKGFVGR